MARRRIDPVWQGRGVSSECVGCHTPLHDNDYVFTVAQRMAQLPSVSTQWNVITPLIDETPATISLLSGNAAAVQHARSSAQRDYPGARSYRW